VGRDETASSVPPVRGGRLLERERELAFLDSLIDEAGLGYARLALVEGPAGIGKSRLVGEVRRRAVEADLRVLAARGGELEREFPFGVVRQLFEPAVLADNGNGRVFAGAAGAARPIFEAVEEGRPADGSSDPSFAVLHGLFWLTVNLSSERPLVVAVDDLHWCDRASLRFLAYLIRRLEGLPVLAVCSLRPSEPGVDTVLLGEIAGDPLSISVRPGPLSEAAVAELVRERLGEGADAVFAAACHAATGGNPLLLNELLKGLFAEGVSPDAEHVGMVADLGPRAASRAVLLRLARLSDDAVAVARAVAILGDGADLSAVAGLARVDELDAARATGELARAEILRPEPPLGFVHPVVGAAVYRDVPPGERELQHGRAAGLLREAGAAVEQVAAHLLATRPKGEASVARTLREAAGHALRKGAAESAVSYLQRALDEPPEADERGAVLFDLGRAEALTSGPSAAEHLQAAYEAIADPAQRGWVASVLARTLLFTGRASEAAVLADQAAAPLGPEHLDLRQRLDGLRLSLAYFDPTTVPRARAELAPYRSELAGEGPGARMLAASAAYHWAMEGGSADRCAELALRALADGTLIEVDNGGGPLIAAIIVLALADRDEALEACDAALADAYRRGSLFAASAGHVFLGIALARRGELADAEDMLRTGLDEVTMWGTEATASSAGPTVPLRLVVSSAALADVLAERGDREGARAALGRAGLPDDPPESTQVGPWLLSRLRLLLLDDRAEDALALADECARRFDTVFRNPGWMPWRSLKAEALDRLGRREEAVTLVRDELELARRWGAPGTVGRTLRVLGRLEREDGLDHLQEAVELLAGSPARLEHAKALAALGSALRLARRPTEARDPLRRALELADVCGAAGLAEQVRSELYAAGARPRTTAVSGVEALTASEHRVVLLAAEGQTNRDIAQALFVTPKTVEVHLSNAYRKLGIGSRRELPAALVGT
jgi:DNA-binding CsgD family transcriptional regulator